MSEDFYYRLYGQCHEVVVVPGGPSTRCERPQRRRRLCWRHYAADLRKERSDTVRSLRRLGCWYENTRPSRHPGDDRPRLPLLVLPPKGFHFETSGHAPLLSTWWDVVALLMGERIVPCHESCRQLQRGREVDQGKPRLQDVNAFHSGQPAALDLFAPF